MRWSKIVAVLASIATMPAFAAEDAYAPLQLYAGRWSVASSHDKAIQLENTCARTGLFFVCEQKIDGASKALVVFLPQGGGVYRTQTLRADGAAPGPWFHLTIHDPDWTYTPEGLEPNSRTLNHVIDADHIHYEAQTREKGGGWKTTLSGDETRVK